MACLLLANSGCFSLLSRAGSRGTCEYPVYPGIANHVFWLGIDGNALSWVALVVDGPLCLVLDTVLLPVDLVVLLTRKDEVASPRRDAIESPPDDFDQPTGARGGTSK